MPLVKIKRAYRILFTSPFNSATADFNAGSSQNTFAVGVETICFNVPILEDDITEDNEIFEIVATPSVGGSPITISVCIRDNDSKGTLYTNASRV